MRFAISLGLACAGAAMMPSASTAVSAADTCDNLAALALPHATITMAQPVAAGAFPPPAGGGGAADPEANSATVITGPAPHAGPRFRRAHRVLI